MGHLHKRLLETLSRDRSSVVRLGNEEMDFDRCDGGDNRRNREARHGMEQGSSVRSFERMVGSARDLGDSDVCSGSHRNPSAMPPSRGLL